MYLLKLMATDIFVYGSLRYYTGHYPIGTTIFQETPVYDMYAKWYKNKPHLWIVTQTNVAKERPDLVKTVVHFRNGSPDKWLEGDETLLHQDSLRYNYKKQQLEVGKFTFYVNRYIGDKITQPNKILTFLRSRVPLYYRYRFYDATRDRLSLILNSRE